MLPSELQNHGLPAVLVLGPEFLVITNTDDIWRDEIIGLGDNHAIGLFEDRHQLSTDVLALDLIRSLTNGLFLYCFINLQFTNKISISHAIMEKKTSAVPGIIGKFGRPCSTKTLTSVRFKRNFSS